MMMTIKLSTREKIIAAVTITLLVLYVVVFWVVKPLQGRLSTLDEGLATASERLAKGKALLARQTDVDAAMRRLGSKWGEASSDAAETSSLVGALERAAVENNVRIINIEPLPSRKNLVAAYPIALTINGASKRIIKFLHVIQSHPLSLSVDSLNIDRSSDGDALVNDTVTVSKYRVIR